MDKDSCGVNLLVRPSQWQQGLHRCKEAGITWVRINVNWNETEPTKGRFNWQNLDTLVPMALKLGLSVYPTLAYTPGWANGNKEKKVPPASAADWQHFVTAIVSRYRNSVRYWGIWNEPNLGQFFAGSREEYISKILLPGAEAVKRVDPGCQIVAPELSEMRKGDWRSWLKEVLKRAANLIDVVAFHIYNNNLGSWGLFRGWGLFHYLDGSKVWPFEGASFKTVLEGSGGKGKPVWITETGWGTDEISESEQAKKLEAFLQGMSKRSWITKVFFYELADDPIWNKKYGITKSDLVPKLAFTKYAGWIRSHSG